jgi:hypothetical protein
MQETNVLSLMKKQIFQDCWQIIKQDRQYTYNVIWNVFVQPALQQKAINITYFECVFVALGIQHAMCVHRIFICGQSGCTIFVYIISQTVLFKKNLNLKYVFQFLYKLCLKHLSL